MIHDVSTAQAAVFVEASQKPNLVDQNVIWNIDGQGVRVADTDNLIVVHNLMGKVAGELVFAKAVTDRSLRGRRLTSTGNRVLNNIFFEPGKSMAFDAGNTADGNVYIWHGDAGAVKRGAEEKKSITLTARPEYSKASSFCSILARHNSFLLFPLCHRARETSSGRNERVS